MRELFPLLLQGTLVTIGIAACSTVLAVVMAFVATAAKLARWAPLRWLGNAYVEIFRGTSLLVQLFWFFFVLPLPPFRIEMTPFTVAIVGLGLHYGAYGSEILRGALRSVPGAQFEAALALNLSPLTRMRRIILPQAMINALPPATNLMIDAVIAGLGVGLGNTMLAGADLEAGRLVKPFELSLKLETGYFLVYWPGALKRPKIKAFRDWMIDQVGSVAGG